MAGQTVAISASGGAKFNGYLATPAGGGKGPGLLVFQEIFGVNRNLRRAVDEFALEGYVALAPDLFWRLEPGVDLGYSPPEQQKAFGYLGRFDIGRAMEDIGAALNALRAMPACNGKAGAVGYCLGGTLAYLTAARFDIGVAVAYYGTEIEKSLGEAKSIKCPMVFHFGEEDQLIPARARQAIRSGLAAHDDAEYYLYRGAGHGFDNHDREVYHRGASALAYTRTLAALRRTIGPRYDLDSLWQQHLDLEFIDRNADQTMTTMVPEPYVNHVPTMTGGTGYRQLLRFYKNHFVNRLPKDFRSIQLSRTIQGDTLVDEFIACFTHDTEIDFMLPGVPPTGKYVEIPHVAIVQFKGDKLYNERIYWDQATALVQLGLIKPEGLPVAGIDAAKKVLDPTLPANTVMARWKESEPKK